MPSHRTSQESPQTASARLDSGAPSGGTPRSNGAATRRAGEGRGNPRRRRRRRGRGARRELRQQLLGIYCRWYWWVGGGCSVWWSAVDLAWVAR
nr:unnamed protein product [Digitaria exilis]